MSGTLQGASPGSLTISSGNAGVFPISYGYYPPEGSRCVSAQYNWSATTGYAEDLSQLVARGVQTSIQSVYIDNSTNNQTVTLYALGTGHVVQCPAGAQGLFPLLFTGTPALQVSVPAVSATGVTRAYYLNVPSQAAQWTPATTAGLEVLVSTVPQSYTVGTVQPVLQSAAGGLFAQIISGGGNAVSVNGTTNSGMLVAGVYRSAPTELANGNNNGVTLDAYSSLNVNTEANAPMYGAGSFFANAAAALDIFTIYGSGTKTIRIHEIGFTGNSAQVVHIIKRSTADTGGTSAAVTAVPLDSSNAAATATVTQYTATPTLGTTVGTLDSINFVANTTRLLLTYGLQDQSIVLRGSSEGLAINLSAAGGAGAVACHFKWSEI